MHRDKIVARILLIFSVANIALAAPTVARQRHLDVAAKAASQKRAGNEESPTVSLSGMPPYGGLTNGWAEPPSAASNRLTSLAPGPPIWGDEPHPPSRLNGWLYWLDPASLPEPYSTEANRIATWGSGATGHLPPGLLSAPLPRPPHNSPPDEGVSSSSNRITTQASGTESSGNGETGHFPPESSSAASDGITTQASGATSSSSSDSGHLGDQPPPPHQGSAPESLAAPEADELFGDALRYTIEESAKKRLRVL